MAKVLKKASKPTKSKPAAARSANAKLAKPKPAKTTPANRKPADRQAKPGDFGPPNWGNVFPEPIPRNTTLPAEVADAIEQVLAGEGKDVKSVAEQAPIDELIAMFTGPALTSGEPCYDEDKIAALSLGEKRQQKKVYWEAESAKNRREAVHVWFTKRLATTPAGRAYLISIAASGDHHARLREFAAHALRDAPPDAALWREIAKHLDPRNWLGALDRYANIVGHTYAVGATGALISDPADALYRFKPLLAPKAVTTKLGELQAKAVLWALGHLLQAGKVDPAPYAGFTPLVVDLIEVEEVEHAAMAALAHLPFEPIVAEIAARGLGPSPTQVSYWKDASVELIARSSDPRYIPWLVGALANNWRHWRCTFEGLANIGDPMGIAIIEAWMVDNAASDRTEVAEPILAALRANGEPTEAQRVEAAGYFASSKKKKKPKK